MILARVDGVIVTTVCHPSMEGQRSIICQPLNELGANDGPPVLAIDPLSAGMHERVLVCTDGFATRKFLNNSKTPLRNLIVAIVDPPHKEIA